MHIHEAGVCQADAKDPACATAPPSRAPRPTRLSVSDILDADGSAVIVHLAADNVANIPTRYHAHTPDATSTTWAGHGDARHRRRRRPRRLRRPEARQAAPRRVVARPARA